MTCYKSPYPEFSRLVIDNRNEPGDCLKNIPGDYNYKVATLHDNYIFVEYGSLCWGGYSHEQKEIIKNVIDGINKNHQPHRHYINR